MQVPVSRGDHPHVDRDGLGASDGPDCVLLQHAKQLHLQSHGHVAHFIEQERAAVGGLENPFLRAGRARNRAFLVPEQLRLQQILRHGAAVDAGERLVSARARLVDGAREDLLAGPALAGDQHPRVGARDHVGLGELVLHQLVAGDDVGAPVLGDVREAGHLERLLHVVEQILLVHRLGQETEGAALGGMHGVGNRAMRGEDDDLESRPAALQLLEQADAVHLVHAQVRDHEVGPESRAGGERGRGAFDGLDLVVLGPQPDGQEPQQARVVVDHQNPRLALLRGGVVARARLQPERQGGGRSD